MTCRSTLLIYNILNKIFGPSRAEVRVETVRVAPDRVEPEYIVIPKDFILLHKKVVLVADILFVDNMAFLVTLSRKIILYQPSS